MMEHETAVAGGRFAVRVNACKGCERTESYRTLTTLSLPTGPRATLDQVTAARPTMDFDGRYGATPGPWTTAMFVEAVYRSLEPAKPAAADKATAAKGK